MLKSNNYIVHHTSLLDRFFASLRKSKCVGESDYIMVVVTGGQIFYLAHIDPLYLTILAGDVS